MSKTTKTSTPKKTNTKSRWFFVTNTRNLEFYMNMGLLADRQIFEGEKRSTELDSNVSGYLTFFEKGNLQSALKQIKNTVVLLELDTTSIQSMKVYHRNYLEPLSESQFNGVCDIQEIPDDSIEILLPAPLPLSCIKQIIVKNKEDIEKLTEVANYYFDSKFIKVEKTPFNKPKIKKISVKESAGFEDDPLFNQDNQNPTVEADGNTAIKEDAVTNELVTVEDRAINYKKILGYGGELALLYYQTKNGRKSTDFFKQHIVESSNNDSNESSDIEKLYDLILNAIQGKNHGEDKKIIVDLLNPEKVPTSYKNKCSHIVGLLLDINNNIIDDNKGDSVTRLCKMRKYFKEEKNDNFADFATFLVVFFMFTNNETMLKKKFEDFEESDYCLLASFVGQAYGFTNVPSVIKQYDDLSLWISYKMACHAHKTSVVFNKEPKQPVLIYDRCINASKTTSYKKHSFYEWLSTDYLHNNDGVKFINWSVSFSDVDLEIKQAQLDKYTITNDGVVNILIKAFLKIKSKFTVQSTQRPKITAEITEDGIEYLEQQIQSQINTDDLFDLNKITRKYKVSTK